MDALMSLSLVFFLTVYLWASATGRKWRAQVARIRKIHGPDARIGYMDLRGRRSILDISIESVKPKGHDCIITAWCHQKKAFLVFHANRIYEFTDLHETRHVTNVPDYLKENYL